ncbi:MAG: hypothetical protein BWZ02_02030 [Lentisphaerae bacterium ADurb.BinA184]|nr:MAG: hypothetical protein BWZ02_02030 [Lentisphaerae bacterium ADurb.BinA184]
MGKPVAFDARALERETRGFISMTTSRPPSGSTANWTFEPPVSTPMARMTAMAASRRRWYSRSVRVCAGATVMLSPVCTPMGSRFSIEQTTTTLSRRSRMTSSSNSFQPSTDSSTSTSWVGLKSSPRRTISSNWAASKAMPPPLPPMVNDGRMTTGKTAPIAFWAVHASSIECAVPLRGTSSPIPSMACLNCSRSSALAIAAALAPISSTL